MTTLVLYFTIHSSIILYITEGKRQGKAANNSCAFTVTITSDNVDRIIRK